MSFLPPSTDGTPLLLRLSTAVQCHGLAACVFSIVFFMEACGFAFPLFSLQWQHPNWEPSKYSTASGLWIYCAIFTFSCYEMLLIPYVPAEMQATIKKIFVVYHIPWCIVVTYCALQPGSDWSAWIDIPVMYGFTIWGAIAKPATPETVAPANKTSEL